MIWAEVLAGDAVAVPMIDVPEDCDYQDYIREVLTLTQSIILLLGYVFKMIYLLS